MNASIVYRSTYAGPAPAGRPFTLVEVVVIMIVAGIMAGLIAPYLTGILRRSSTVPETLRGSCDLVTVMERIAYDYENNPALYGDLEAFRTKVESVPEVYGHYEVVECKFIAYDADGNEIAGTNTDNLKVSIKNDSAILTQVFPYWSTE